MVDSLLRASGRKWIGMDGLVALTWRLGLQQSEAIGEKHQMGMELH